MNKEQFKRIQANLGYSNLQMAQVFDYTLNMIEYLRQGGRAIPRAVALVMILLDEFRPSLGEIKQIKKNQVLKIH